MLYGLPLTTSPAARVKLASVVDTLPVSLIATVPFHVTIAGLLTTPPRFTAMPASDGSSCPYPFVWFAIVPVSAAGVIDSVLPAVRSEDLTSELQLLTNLVCR